MKRKGDCLHMFYSVSYWVFGRGSICVEAVEYEAYKLDG